MALELEMSSEAITLRNELRRKDEFIAMLGHELRNPLSVLTTASRIFRIDQASCRRHETRRGSHRPPGATGHPSHQRSAGRRTHHNGKLQLDRRSVDLRELVTATLESRRADADRRKHLDRAAD